MGRWRKAKGRQRNGSKRSRKGSGKTEERQGKAASHLTLIHFPEYSFAGGFRNTVGLPALPGLPASLQTPTIHALVDNKRASWGRF